VPFALLGTFGVRVLTRCQCDTCASDAMRVVAPLPSKLALSLPILTCFTNLLHARSTCTVPQGLYGAGFNQANIMWCRVRKSTWLRRYPITEVVLITFITALLAFPSNLTR